MYNEPILKASTAPHTCATNSVDFWEAEKKSVSQPKELRTHQQYIILKHKPDNSIEHSLCGEALQIPNHVPEVPEDYSETRWLYLPTVKMVTSIHVFFL